MGTAAIPHSDAELIAPVRTVNAQGRGPFALVCDHASNRIPAGFGSLGLPPAELVRHIAWDPGALAISLRLTELLDAPLVHSTVSRLVVDCNRYVDSDTLMPALSETTAVPGNAQIGAAERGERVARYHAPYHAAVDALLAARDAAGLETILVCMHSFTPIYNGVRRPWPIGVLTPARDRFSRALHAALCDEVPDVEIGWNQPYAGGQGVSYTVDKHGAERDATMIEIRHDEILEPSGVALWADRLGRCLTVTRQALHGHEVALGTTDQHTGGLNG